MYALYTLLTTLAAAPGAAYLALRPEHRPLLERFRPLVPECPARPVWIQACSVGEVQTALPLIERIRERWPDCPVIVTASTVQGRRLAVERAQDAAVAWFPFDAPWIVRRFVRALRPRLLVLVETEVWPAAVRETRRSGAPVVLVNGRISDRHFARYRAARPLLKHAFADISAAAMQNELYARRLVALGAGPAVVRVTGNTKFDGLETDMPPEERCRLRQENGFAPDDLIVLFGSTRPGDEALAARCLRELGARFPALRLVVAPRHLDRLGEVLACFDAPVRRRTEAPSGAASETSRVFVLDTVGELRRFYGIADVAVIGGSFDPRIQGHNPLEPAALGVATVFGPQMRNFLAPAEALLTARGALQLTGPDDLVPTLERLLADSEQRRAIAERGRSAVLANQGALDRTLEFLAEFLDRAP